MLMPELNSAEVVKSHEFKTYDMGIKNPQVVFHILCDKTYQHPLTTMIQEYMSNARDAHREKGNTDRPIEIILPTALDLTLSITDFGPGISVDRMADVFIYLGESTKRADNNQHGGFGIGAKIGFAYTDSFHIISRHDGIETEYLAYKGEDQLGHIDEISYKDYIGEDGVTIQLPIRSFDIESANAAVLKCCYFWKTPPVLTNLHLTFDGIKLGKYSHIPVHKMVSVPVEDSALLYEKILNYSKKPLIVVDRIIYGGLQESHKIEYKKLVDSSIIFVDTGEVDIAVNRENLQYTDRTWSILNKIIKTNIHKSRELAIGNLISTPEYDLYSLAKHLKHQPNSSVTNIAVDLDWGNYNIRYKPKAKVPLSVRIPKSWSLYNFREYSYCKVGREWISRVHNKGEDDNLYIPISDEYRYVLDDRNTSSPSPTLAYRWYREKKATQYLILRHQDRNEKVDEWIFEVGKEITVDLLSVYAKKVGKKASSKDARENITFRDPYNKKRAIKSLSIFEWLEEDPTNLLILTPARLYNDYKGLQAESMRKIYTGKDSLIDQYNEAKLLTVSNRIVYKRLLKENCQICSIEDWILQMSRLHRNYMYNLYQTMREKVTQLRLVSQRLEHSKDEDRVRNRNLIDVQDMLSNFKATDFEDPYIVDMFKYNDLYQAFRALTPHRLRYQLENMSNHKRGDRVWPHIKKYWPEIASPYSTEKTWRLDRYFVLQECVRRNIQLSKEVVSELIECTNQQYRRRNGLSKE